LKVPKFVVLAEGPTWDAIRRAASQVAELVARDEVDMNALGHALGALVSGVRAGFEGAALPSLRLDAAARALDLKTPKSALLVFLGRGSS
jgi:hypothetical protein